MISGSTLGDASCCCNIEDDGAKQIINENNYEISLNTKFQLSIKNVSSAEVSKSAPKKKGKDTIEEEAE